jgi:hypothetical protein
VKQRQAGTAAYENFVENELRVISEFLATAATEFERRGWRLEIKTPSARRGLPSMARTYDFAIRASIPPNVTSGGTHAELKIQASEQTGDFFGTIEVQALYHGDCTMRRVEPTSLSKLTKVWVRTTLEQMVLEAF